MLNKEDVLQSGSRCLVGEKAQDRRFCKHLSRERGAGLEHTYFAAHVPH
jgi:hypothetical protein